MFTSCNFREKVSMLLNNENKKSKRIKIKKKIINEFCYILCFMVINNNFLEYIFFLQKNFARNLLIY